ncbi:MAG: acyltransferase [Alteromonadaceae bacterium]|jgi:sugar O-acyltransferase (sialic acid O-acetyltransferase NeuD family)|uniref:2,3,4,5-tetrahydropyridine-2,6-dicarboxylate N-acetyltransferase n=1 Tax=Paraglaciecola mesophila KMM 241 TaxID=1128912 RepID=K6Y1A8_9ALTE|nr:acetyltransferase [Paraglaciecola mesophila]MAD16093.1 acyltransferase [Alteromonadaceae bacterium]MBB19826.1 acyltransferase [Rickettsiales bacterium]GAC26624.1 2,3,4,5-tetrahydropyridine-2,6-dicarboxylate N-acetyltransferase [Paraglaciecola mesophila KMM 241]|tara:strand:- start:395 stop:1030 length:636 start_codon:yes stop_codon:yes gene_type:complete
MINKLIIIGASGHGKVAADCAEASRRFSEIRFLDQAYPEQKTNAHWDVVAHADEAMKYVASDTLFFVAIGNNAIRAKVTDELLAQHCSFATLVHPSAHVSRHSEIGLGSLICANATVNIASKIGQGCIINTAASVDHDCVLGDFVHVAPGSRLAGNVTVEDQSFIGIGSAIIQGCTIGRRSIVGAGSTVLSNISEHTIVAGSPAKKINNNN